MVSNYLSDKTLNCDATDCYMKLFDEDNVVTHNKKNDMILSLGIGQKVSTFSDQTPTPTQFFRNCEEVGLFQDLQNVNPFEETFKKAVEAVKSGQPINMVKPSSKDDTLHTPKIFPVITDVPNINQDDNMRGAKISIDDKVLLKKELPDSNKAIETDISNHDLFDKGLSEENSCYTIPLYNTENSNIKSSSESTVILMPESHYIQFTAPNVSPNSCNMVVLQNAPETVYSSIPVSVKEKLKKSLCEKKIGKVFQHKVPISKCPAKKMSNTLHNKFSKFSKNALKVISKLENCETEDNIVHVPCERQKKKADKFCSKESRSEFLARSRAASSRCREKKKMYVLHLEKLNRELSAANQNLQLTNASLRMEIWRLHVELSKHKNCDVPSEKSKAALVSTKSFIKETNLGVEEKFTTETKQTIANSNVLAESLNPTVEVKNSKEETVPLISKNMIDQDYYLDVAEVTLNEKSDQWEIPLKEYNKQSDIIVKFNSGGNGLRINPPPACYSVAYSENTNVKVKRVFAEHSYFLKTSFVDVNKSIMNFKTFTEVVSTVTSIQSDESSKLEANSQSNKVFRTTNQKSILEPRTPPPLILLKPFKKRTLKSSQSEKT